MRERQSSNPHPQSVPTHSPILPPVLAQVCVWQLSELIPIKTKPACTQNWVMSRQRWGTSSFVKNTNLCLLRSDCKTMV